DFHVTGVQTCALPISVCQGEAVRGLDQRGYWRPLESCSIGAFDPNASLGPYVATPAGRLLPHGGSRSIYWLPLAIRDLDGQPVHSLFIATQLRPVDAPAGAGPWASASCCRSARGSTCWC